MDNTYTNNTYESTHAATLRAPVGASAGDIRLSQDEVDILVDALQDAAYEANNVEQNSRYAHVILALVDRILPLQSKNSRVDSGL